MKFLWENSVSIQLKDKMGSWKREIWRQKSNKLFQDPIIQLCSNRYICDRFFDWNTSMYSFIHQVWVKYLMWKSTYFYHRWFGWTIKFFKIYVVRWSLKIDAKKEYIFLSAEITVQIKPEIAKLALYFLFFSILVLFNNYFSREFLFYEIFWSYTYMDGRCGSIGGAKVES